MLSGCLLAVGLAGCQEQSIEAGPSVVVSQSSSSAGEEISRDQAVSWTYNFRAQYPDGLRAVGFSAEGLRSLLAQEGCTGIRLYHATNDSQEHLFLLVGSDAAGRDQTDGLLLDASPRCPKWCAISPFAGNITGFAAAFAPDALPVSQEEAVRWTATYQQNHVGELRSVFYDEATIESLLQQSHNTGIRFYQAITHNREPTFVLVGIDDNYEDQIRNEDRFYANGMPCTHGECMFSSLLLH